MEPITTLNKEKWATSTRCKDQEKMGLITTLKEKNGSHRHCADTRNKMGHIANEQRTATKSRNTSERLT